MEDIAVPDPLDVASRLAELRILDDGWLEGSGAAPPADFLDWLSEAFDRYFPEDLPSPYIFPTPEGGVQAEWSLPNCEASLEIDPRDKNGEWHVLDGETEDETLHELELGDSDGWVELISQIRAMSKFTT